MKRHLFLVLFLITVFIAVFSFVPVKQAERFYYAFEEKIPLETVEGWYVISYDSTLDTIAESARLAARHDILSLSWKNNRTTILQLGKETVLATVEEELLETSNAYTIQPLYRLASGLEMPVTDELVIGLPDGSIEEVSMLHKRFAVTVLETNEVFQLLRVPKGADALEIANHYQESGFVEFSHPNFLTFSQSFQAIPNDPYFNNQFYLRNTGQVFNPVENHAGTPGADISILGAWDVTMGENTVVVAVLDDGVTANHPDLPNARQVRLNGSNFGAGNANDPSPTGQDSHGNACAGIIAATGNNGEGIAGIAPNVRIMPVRTRNATPANVAAAILFAVNNGTHILSCSWGYDSDNPNFLPVIVGAIQHAVTNGRSGLGSVVVFAASNSAWHGAGNPGEIQFPSNVNIPGVFTVGASDRDDVQSEYSPTSMPGSPNNQIIDIVAPSHRAYPVQIVGETLEVWSIDVPGNDGNNPWPNLVGQVVPPAIGEQLPNAGVNFLSYTGRFGGTSAAAPQIAGIAALVLSINPNLTQQQVFEIITGTADQVGGYNYVNGRSDELGFGRANACRAVYEAYESTQPLTGPATLCTSATYTLTNLPAGATITGWSASPSGAVTLSGSGNSRTVTKVGNFNGG